MSFDYCMFKGTLIQAAPYKDEYNAKPHYVITVSGGGGGGNFNIVVNSASAVPAGSGGDTGVLSYIDPNFDDIITAKLASLSPGLHTSGFPRLDYWQDRSLLDISRFRPVPYHDEDGSRFDINDLIDEQLTIDETQPSFLAPYFNGKTTQQRHFWKPQNPGVVVYGFGFLFPSRDGLHETHMNQGNPKNGGHAQENGAFQDGAVMVQIGDQFAAIFTAFQSQYLPTLANGYPAPDARPIGSFLAQG
jgi:uncharacterized protein YukJ